MRELITVRSRLARKRIDHGRHGTRLGSYDARGMSGGVRRAVATSPHVWCLHSARRVWSELLYT